MVATTEVLLAVAFIAALLALRVLQYRLERRSTGSAHDFPYQKKEALLTAAECQFYVVLQGLAAVEKLDVFAKVRIEDVIEVRKGARSYQSHRNRISSRHLDFVLCDRQKTAPMLVIELNDSSHKRRKRQQRDEFVEKALEVAGIPLLWLPVQDAYPVHELSRQVREKLGRSTDTPNTTVPNSRLISLRDTHSTDQATLPEGVKAP